MIRAVEVVITFPQGAYFVSSLNEYILKKLYGLIKNICCINKNVLCDVCSSKQDCRYYAVTGDNFKEYPGIKLDILSRNKKKFAKGQEKTFKFYFVGSATDFEDYVGFLFADSLGQYINKQPFLLTSIKKGDLNKNANIFFELNFKTIINSLEIIKEYNEMINYFNNNYGCNYKKVKDVLYEWDALEIQMPALKLPSKRVQYKGYIGQCKCKKGVSFSEDILEMGIGKTNYIGGGQIEIDNTL